MAIIYSYPLSTPKSSDLLIGTSVYDENAAQPVLGNPTVSFTLQSVLSMIASSTGAQNLQQVTNIGNTTTNAVVFESSISVTGRFIDSGGNSGTPAKILSSTGTGTSWITPVATGVTKIIAGTNVTITPAGGIGNVTINSSGGLVTSLTTTGTGVSTLVSGVLNIPTPVIPAVPFVSLTTTGTSGDATLTTGVLNIPDYANTQNTLTTTGTGVATLVGTVLNIPTPVIPVVNFTSLTTTGAGAATLSAGVLNVPTPVIPVVNFTSLTTTGTSGASTLSSGVLNVPDYTYTETDTLQTVTTRGNTTNKSIIMNGSGAEGYLYVTGNAGSPVTNPTHAQGFAFAYNNSGGSRECEVFWNTGTTTVTINNSAFLGFYNEFLNSDAGNARVSDLQMKLYGTGQLELTGNTPTISNPYWRMPTVAGTGGQVLARSAGSINLEWVSNAGGGGVTGSGTQYALPIWDTAAGTNLGDSKVFQEAAGTAVFFGTSSNYLKVTTGQNAFDCLESINNLIVRAGATAKESQIYLGNNSGAYYYGGSTATDGDYGGSGYGIFMQPGDGDFVVRQDPFIDYLRIKGKTDAAKGKVSFGLYGSGTFTGTPAYNLSVDSSGNMIETANASITGSGAVTQITSWDSATSITGVAEYTIDSNFNVSQAADTDVKNTIGRAVVYGDTDFAVFSHIDRQGGLTYAFMASPFGSTYINATGGSQAVYILDDNSTVAVFDRDLIQLAAINVQLGSYGSGTKTGTAAYNLSVDSTGKIIETENNKTFVLTAAQMQGLHTTPVTLLPSPGTNKAYKILACSTYLNFVQQFAISAGNDVSIYTTDGSSNSDQVRLSSNAYTANSSNIYSMDPNSLAPQEIYINSALLIRSLIAITGGTGSTFSIKLTYQILDTTNF